MIQCIQCGVWQTHRICKYCYAEPAWEQCDSCDHTYRPGEACTGIPVACERCCTNSLGDTCYVPTYVISEMAL